MNNEFNNGSDVTRYRATKNLNTSLENPQFNVGDTHDVNLTNISVNINTETSNKNLDIGEQLEKIENNYNDFQNSLVSNVEYSSDNNKLEKQENIIEQSLNNGDNNLNSNTFVNGATSIDNINSTYNDFTSNVSDNKVTYAPVNKSKKKKISLMIPKELLILFILVFIILIFIYIIPSLYEFFRTIRLSIIR